MANMQMTKTPMPEQDPNVRNKNFKEVTLGYTAEMAINEAQRCMQCKKPKCVEGCPVNIRIPEFIAKVAEGDFAAAYEVITSTNALPALSGRVCPQETQCESKCVRGVKGEPVAIGRLERFVADWYRENVNAMPEKVPSNGIKVAVVGSGPSGLTCASELAKKGYEVSIFEALHTAGGVLVYGIPEFRLPKAIVANEVEKLKAQGVTVMTDMVIGKVLSIDELFEELGFKAVFVGSGAGLPMFMHIPGEALKGVCSANEYLTRINLMKAYKEEYDTPILHSKAAAIVGGGNVAMDAARCAKRMGAEKVYIVYRRGEAEMPARLEEQHHAKEEGMDMIRPGVATYGFHPSPDTVGEIDLRPMMSLHTSIAQIRTIAAGKSISYGRTYTTPEDKLVAVLPIGYADGLSRLLSNRVTFRICGKEAPVVGRICMDMCMVDISEIPEAKVGTTATLFGYDEEGTLLPCERIADMLGTINYEIVCDVNKRVPRFFYKDGKQVGILQYIV